MNQPAQSRLRPRRWRRTSYGSARVFGECGHVSGCRHETNQEFTASAPSGGSPRDSDIWLPLCPTCKDSPHGRALLHATYCGCGAGWDPSDL